MQKVQVFLKQFGESVINSIYKFRRDLFWRTELIIIGILFLLCFLNIVIVTLSADRLHFEIASLVISTVDDVLKNGIQSMSPSILTTDLVDQLHLIRNQYIVIVGTVSIIITLIFGYLVVRTALGPTRNALKSQKQFIGNIAHELRTPLSVVRANAEIMIYETANNPSIQALAKSNLEEIDRTSGIINNLLTLNTFHHLEDVAFSFVDISKVCESTLDMYKGQLEQKNITINKNIEESLLVWGNKNAIGQIAANLLKNAIAYSNAGGTIALSTKVDGMKAGFEIKDYGIGIEEEKLTRIFEPFYKIDPSRSHSTNSSGLGLTIVNELIKLHNGSVALQSIFGKGTAVKVMFPKRAKRMFPKKTKLIHDTDHIVSLDYSGKS